MMGHTTSTNKTTMDGHDMGTNCTEELKYIPHPVFK